MFFVCIREKSTRGQLPLKIEKTCWGIDVMIIIDFVVEIGFPYQSGLFPPTTICNQSLIFWLYKSPEYNWISFIWTKLNRYEFQMSIPLQTLHLLPFNCLPVNLEFSIKANYTTAIISTPTPDIMFQKDTRKLNISP